MDVISAGPHCQILGLAVRFKQVIPAIAHLKEQNLFLIPIFIQVPQPIATLFRPLKQLVSRFSIQSDPLLLEPLSPPLEAHMQVSSATLH